MKKFEEIIGYEEEKEELRRLCDAMNNREKYSALGVDMPRALLLYGEPGVGKTLMAETLIEESGRICFSCKKDRADGAFTDKIRETFKNAEENQPSIVFLDDMDKFAQDNLREDSNKEEFAVIQSCLEDMKGKDVFTVATANDIFNIPRSLLREGRFGRQIKVETPSREDAVKIVARFLTNKKTAEDLTAEFAAEVSAGRSCAYLENVVNEAGLYAGYENRSTISRKDFIFAALRVSTQCLPSETTNEKEKRKICYHEAGHAVAAALLGEKVALLSAKRYGDVGGVCCSFDDEEVLSFEKFKNIVVVSLAGKASAEIVYGVPDFGAGWDIKKASRLTERCVEELALKGFSRIYWKRYYSEKQPIGRIDRIADSVSEILSEFYEETVALITKNRNLLDKVADALYEREFLVWDDVRAIMNIA